MAVLLPPLSGASLMLVAASLVLVVDVLSKAWVQRTMSLSESVPVVPNVFYLTYIQNRGAAFGILPGQRWLFVVVALGVAVASFVLMGQLGRRERLARLGLGLFLGGALGNLVDRLRHGAVVDFLDLRFWPTIFNLADVAIVLGVGLLLVQMLRSERPSRTRPV